jgi:hypothetical protein
MMAWVLFVMHVTAAMTFNEYWSDRRFQMKKPNLRGSKKQAFGDNIYFRDPKTGEWHQENSHHSLENGSINEANVTNDTQTDRVLIGDDFVYWGGSGPELPSEFLNYGAAKADLCAVRNHKNKFPPNLVHAFVQWVKSLNEFGCIGDPLDWSKTP